MPVEAPGVAGTRVRLYPPYDVVLVVRRGMLRTVLYNDGRLAAPGLHECETCGDLVDPVADASCPWCGAPLGETAGAGPGDGHAHTGGALMRLPYVDLGDLDGTHGWVRTSGFVNWEEDISSHMPRQRVRIGDDSTDGAGAVCTVFTDDVDLEPGYGYYFIGVDRTYDAREEVQLSLVENSRAEKFYE